MNFYSSYHSKIQLHGIHLRNEWRVPQREVGLCRGERGGDAQRVRRRPVVRCLRAAAGEQPALQRLPRRHAGPL